MPRYDIDPDGKLVDIDSFDDEVVREFAHKALDWAVTYALEHYGDFRFSNQYDAKHLYRKDMQAFLDENWPPELAYDIASNVVGLCVLKACMGIHNYDHDMDQCHEYPDGHPRFTRLEQFDSILWLVVATGQFLTRESFVQKMLDYYNTINRNLHAIDPSYNPPHATIEDVVVEDGKGMS